MVAVFGSFWSADKRSKWQFKTVFSGRRWKILNTCILNYEVVFFFYSLAEADSSTLWNLIYASLYLALGKIISGSVGCLQKEN